MALGYFVQFLKEATLALLIHFFLKVEQTCKKKNAFLLQSLMQRAQRALGWKNEHIYSESIQRINMKHEEVRVPM
jgi:hypothetical protein